MNYLLALACAFASWCLNEHQPFFSGVMAAVAIVCVVGPWFFEDDDDGDDGDAVRVAHA